MKFLPFIFSALWFVARIIVGQFTAVDKGVAFGALSNVLLILVLIFIAIYHKYKNHQGERPSFFDDFKSCMKAAAKYVLLTVFFIGIYYGVVSDDIAEIRQSRIEAFTAEINTAEGLAKYQEQFPDLKGKSPEQLIATNIENVERFVSVKSQIIGALLVLTAVSLVYSLLAVVFWRSFIKRI